MRTFQALPELITRFEETSFQRTGNSKLTSIMLLFVEFDDSRRSLVTSILSRTWLGPKVLPTNDELCAICSMRSLLRSLKSELEFAH